MKDQHAFVTASECNKAYEKLNMAIGENQLCAAAGEECIVDSGGSLIRFERHNNREFYEDSLGIMSYGPKICVKDALPNVYTRVDKYLAWIVSKLKA